MEWQQHGWYDLGATQAALYDMRHRLAMGCPALPRSVGSTASALHSQLPPSLTLV